MPASKPAERLAWAALAVGLLAMYLPVYYTMATTLWDQDTQEHGPIVLAVSLYLAWQSRHALFLPNDSKSYPLTGWLLLIVGILLYVVGQSQSIVMFAVGSQIPVFVGIVLLAQGKRGLRAFWFPILFLAFMVPLPGFAVDAATNPLKQHVSILAEQILYFLHYPIARNGVVLTIGPYQLLVADACSGLHSIFSLSAMGFLYLFLMRHDSVTRNLLLVATILPIAFLSNVIRVVVLALITYYLGDEAGQGFLHGFAGIMLFVVAVLCLFLVDWMLGFFFPDVPLSQKKTASVANAEHETSLNMSQYARSVYPKFAWVGAIMILALGLSIALTPRTMLSHEEKPIDLEAMIPKQFGPWHMVDLAPQIVDPETRAELDKIYNQTLSRTYVNANGQIIMLALAYGGNQSNGMQVHKPEVCYPAQGFQIVQQPKVSKLALPYGYIPVRRLVAQRGERVEPITYWITVGDAVATTSIERRLQRIKYGVTGVIPDGLLFRVSTITSHYDQAYALENTFIEDLLKALPSASRKRLIGVPTRM